ncbi:hypothetical protein MA16_Dca024940 [Dendrobium catenatum]|uniref:Uncharacterized protein n=1 Tax=Dendrobium catenatum TaxID=906689 RepID=A0A2I0VJ51_9ASPA|nr:hypothetical protein MA16_Dca024940 [Dendrobium catenatum]
MREGALAASAVGGNETGGIYAEFAIGDVEDAKFSAGEGEDRRERWLAEVAGELEAGEGTVGAEAERVRDFDVAAEVGAGLCCWLRKD